MDLTKTVSYLAEANQKLAITNNFTLNYLEKFYLQLNSNKKSNVPKNKLKSTNRKLKKFNNNNNNEVGKNELQKVTADNEVSKEIN